MISSLKFEYHDGWIGRVEIGQRQDVVLAVNLDTVWNPGNDRVLLTLDGIVNVSSVLRFFESIAAEASEVDGGPRIDALFYDKKKRSKPGDLYLYVKVDTFGYIRVHCRNITEELPG